MNRTLSVLATVAALTGCELLPSKPAPTPPPRLVVCAPDALQACQPVRYALPDGQITADQAAAIAIAERAAWCECATRHAAALNCIAAHNGAGREGPAPCPEPNRR
jgi:hypothetical protein